MNAIPLKLVEQFSTDQAIYKANDITKIENYFNSEINHRKSCIKKLGKYVGIFNYIGKVLIILSATSGEICIISSVNVAGAPVGLAVASFTLIFLSRQE